MYLLIMYLYIMISQTYFKSVHLGKIIENKKYTIILLYMYTYSTVHTYMTHEVTCTGKITVHSKMKKQKNFCNSLKHLNIKVLGKGSHQL